MTELNIDIADILERKRLEIETSAMEVVTQTLKNKFQYRYDQDINKIVDEFFNVEIAPKIKEALHENKDKIVDACIKSAVEVATAIGESMTKRALETMAQDWKAKEVIKKVLDV